jgi:hypothetical protein
MMLSSGGGAIEYAPPLTSTVTAFLHREPDVRRAVALCEVHCAAAGVALHSMLSMARCLARGRAGGEAKRRLRFSLRVLVSATPGVELEVRRRALALLAQIVYKQLLVRERARSTFHCTFQESRSRISVDGSWGGNSKLKVIITRVESKN